MRRRSIPRTEAFIQAVVAAFGHRRLPVRQGTAPFTVVVLNREIDVRGDWPAWMLAGPADRVLQVEALVDRIVAEQGLPSFGAFVDSVVEAYESAGETVRRAAGSEDQLVLGDGVVVIVGPRFRLWCDRGAAPEDRRAVIEELVRSLPEARWVPESWEALRPHLIREVRPVAREERDALALGWTSHRPSHFLGAGLVAIDAIGRGDVVRDARDLIEAFGVSFDALHEAQQQRSDGMDLAVSNDGAVTVHPATDASGRWIESCCFEPVLDQIRARLAADELVLFANDRRNISWVGMHNQDTLASFVKLVLDGSPWFRPIAHGPMGFVPREEHPEHGAWFDLVAWMPDEGHPFHREIDALHVHDELHRWNDLLVDVLREVANCRVSAAHPYPVPSGLTAVVAAWGPGRTLLPMADRYALTWDGRRAWVVRRDDLLRRLGWDSLPLFDDDRLSTWVFDVGPPPPELRAFAEAEGERWALPPRLQAWD